jgi:hypothetical protein
VLVLSEENVVNLVEKNDVSAKTLDKTKRPYTSPVLTEYGDIRQITQNSHRVHGSGDSSRHPNKTLP